MVQPSSVGESLLNACPRPPPPPVPAARKEFEGIFGMGVPENVLFSFGHWYRMSQPLEKVRPAPSGRRGRESAERQGRRGRRRVKGCPEERLSRAR